MNLIAILEQEEIARLGKKIPNFAPGDTVVVSVNVVEGERKRTQAFEGVVIAKRNAGLNSSFIVRKVSAGEGVDERLLDKYVDEEISIGDYVLSGGELAAMVVIDSLVRQLPGVLGDAESAQQDSFVHGLLDCPHYTRPEIFEGEGIPEVLLSGHHAEIEKWRLKQALGRTWQRRPDLLAQRQLTQQEARLLAEYQQEQASVQQEEIK